MADHDAEDAADDQGGRHQDRDDQRALERFGHDQETADHVEHAGQQVQQEAAPLAVHEGVHDLEHAGHQQQGTNEDDAGDGKRDDVEPGDDAEHQLRDAEGDKPAPAGAWAGTARSEAVRSLMRRR